MYKGTYAIWTYPLLLLLLVPTVWAASGLQAYVDTAEVADGELVRLHIEAEGQVSKPPDTSPLAQDFEVLGTASGSRVSIINGRSSSRTTWTITLRPRHSGTLSIPPLQVGTKTTQAIPITVTDAPTADSSDADVLIETSVSTHDPYVQQMVIYTIKIYHAVELTEGTLSEPEAGSAVIQQLGDDDVSREYRNGHSYRVITRRYAIFPQASGNLELPAPVLDAAIPERHQRQNPIQDFFGNDPFFDSPSFDSFFTQTRPIRVRGAAIAIHVKPKPSSYQEHYWLPAKQLELTEDWDLPDTPLKVGEPITRSVTITAQGLTAGQLPRPEVPQLPNAGVYADKPQESTSTTADTVTGQLRQRIVFVPNQSGRLEIPGIRITWWNTETQQAAVAELPPRSFVIEVPTGQTTLPPPAANPPPQATLHTPPAATQISPASAQRVTSWFWMGIAGMFALLWLITLWLWWKNKRHKDTTTLSARLDPSEPLSEQREHKPRRAFLRACEKNQPKEARAALLSWAAAHWPEDPPQGLEEVAARIQDQHVRQLLRALDAAIYADRPGAWQGAELARQLKRLPATKKTDAEQKILPKLYS